MFAARLISVTVIVAVCATLGKAAGVVVAQQQGHAEAVTAAYATHEAKVNSVMDEVERSAAVQRSLLFWKKAVAATNTASHPCNLGEFTISSDEDLLAIYNCTTIIGTLVVSSASGQLHSFELPNLKYLEGSFRYDTYYDEYYFVPAIEFASLTAISGDIDLQAEYAENLTRIGFPELIVVGGYVSISAAQILQEVDFSSLTSVGLLFSLTAWNYPVAAPISFPVLVSVRELFCNCLSLAAASLGHANTISAYCSGPVSMPVLTTAGDVLISGASDVTLSSLEYTQSLSFFNIGSKTLNLPKLTSVFGNNGIEVGSCGVTSLSAPFLQIADGLSIYDNWALQTVSLPSLLIMPMIEESTASSASTFGGNGNVEVYNNPKLVSFSLLSLQEVFGSFSIEDSALPDLSGISSLQLTLDLVIHNNTKMKTLAGLSNLANVEGSLTIALNTVLSDISQITRPTLVVAENAFFYEDSSLCTSAITKWSTEARIDGILEVSECAAC